jgi:hypothetical protein
MKKLITITMIFALGYMFGGSALRVVRVAWSELTEKACPSLWDDLEDRLRDVSIQAGS